jgi:hypothetical protein
MTPEEFADAVRSENRTALSRLGSSKSLYADTMGEMESEEVLRAAATAEHAAARTFEAWADDESDDTAAAVFEATAEEEREHHDRVAGELDDHEPGEVPAIQEYLRGLEDTVERLGGLVGRTLAADGSKGQMTGFFTGRADPQTAQLFRDLSGDLDGQVERAVEALDAVCNDDEDWDRGLEAGSGAIGAAYEEYTERLERMDVNPKPVC